MRPQGTGFVRPSSKRYLMRRMAQLASAKNRGLTEPLAQWAEKRIQLEGRRFSFVGHEYLKALYDETAGHIALMKAAQVGGTVWGLLRSIHACINGLNGVYYCPTKTDVLEFSKARVGPLIDENPFLAELMNDTDTAGLKRIGQAHLYFRGMQSSVGLKSVPADMLVFDELDEADPHAKAMAKERLSHSDFKRIIELSNPSLPDYGIDELYQQSDQRHWTLKCSGCTRWVCLDREFPMKLGQEVRIILPRLDGSFYRACPTCEAELDLAAGEWVADFPTRAIHGYLISQLISSKVDPGEILHEYRTTRFPGNFYNLKIGAPYSDLELKLDVMSVLSLCSDVPMARRSDDWCNMGVDTGSQLHVVILRADPNNAEKHHVVYIGIHHEFEELDALMQDFKVERCVVDGMPEQHSTRRFVQRHPGIAYRHFFNDNQTGAPRWDHLERKVDSNRTESLDASRAAVREKMLVLPRREPIVETFAKHMAADAKKLEEDPETGAKRYRYIKAGGQDHLSLAVTYALLASQDYSGGRGIVEFYRRQARKRP